MVDLFQEILKALPGQFASSIWTGGGILLVLKQIDGVLQDALKEKITLFLTSENGLSSWSPIINSLRGEVARVFYFFTPKNFITAISIAVGCFLIATSVTGVLQEAFAEWHSSGSLGFYVEFVLFFIVANLVVQLATAAIAKIAGFMKWRSLTIVLLVDFILRVALIVLIFGLVGYLLVQLMNGLVPENNNLKENLRLWDYILLPLVSIAGDVSLALALGLILSSPACWLFALSFGMLIVWVLGSVLNLGARVINVAKFPLSYAAVVAIVGFNCVYVPVATIIERYVIVNDDVTETPSDDGSR